jgi:hypothetical protein
MQALRRRHAGLRRSLSQTHAGWIAGSGKPLSAARNGACRAPEPQETVPEYTLPWQCRPASIAALHVSRREFAESAHAGGIVDDAQNRE